MAARVPKVNIIIPQGETYKHRFVWVDENDLPIDNTAYTGARLQIRQYHEAADPPEVSLTVGSGLTLGGVSGTIDVEIASTLTETFTWTRGVYDLEMVIPGSPDDVTRAVEGRVTVTPEVTR